MPVTYIYTYKPFKENITIIVHLTKLKGILVVPSIWVEADKFRTNSDVNQSLSHFPMDPKEEHWAIMGQSDGTPDGRLACVFKILFKYV